MKKLAALLLFLMCLGAAPAHANCTTPCTKAQTTTDINTNWPDNTTQLITPALLRSTVLDLVNSYTDINGASSFTCPTNQFLTAIATLSTYSCTQPAFTNISGTATVPQGGTGQTTLTANAFLTGNGVTAINQVALTGLVVGNGASAPTAYGGVTCTNQFLSALSAAGVGTCTSPTLTSAQFANQGTTTTVLHGNAAGNASFAAVSLTADVTGTLPVTNGGTGDTGTAWSAFTPSPTCGTATFTVNSARSKTLGKTTFWESDVTITALGTCTSTISQTLPNTANSSAMGTGAEVVNTAQIVACRISSASATATCQRQTGVSFTVNDRVIVSGVYENQ